MPAQNIDGKRTAQPPVQAADLLLSV